MARIPVGEGAAGYLRGGCDLLCETYFMFTYSTQDIDPVILSLKVALAHLVPGRRGVRSPGRRSWCGQNVHHVKGVLSIYHLATKISVKAHVSGSGWVVEVVMKG